MASERALDTRAEDLVDARDRPRPVARPLDRRSGVVPASARSAAAFAFKKSDGSF